MSLLHRARRTLRAAPLLAALLLLGTAGASTKRLEEAERDHYAALKVWMTDKEQKSYLKLKTRAERDAWLQSKGYWDRFYKYDAGEREKILNGDVRRGWTQDKVFMAWGPPHSLRQLPGRKATRSEELIYRFEVSRTGRTLVWAPNSKETHTATAFFHVVLIVDDGVVAEMEQRDGWP